MQQGGLCNELHPPDPQLWSEGGGEGVVGLYRAEEGVQDQVSWTSAPTIIAGVSCYSKSVSSGTEVV